MLRLRGKLGLRPHSRALSVDQATLPREPRCEAPGIGFVIDFLLIFR